MSRKTKTPEYQSWIAMRHRCYLPHYVQYKDYGGRGIRMCERWRDSFEAFVEDMGPRPSGTTIDRIDADGHYEPGNCRWATRREQNANRRSVISVTRDGVTMCLAGWCRLLGLHYSRVHKRITHLKWSVDEALGFIERPNLQRSEH